MHIGWIGSFAVGLMWGWLVVLVFFRMPSPLFAVRVVSAGLATAMMCLQTLAFSGHRAAIVFAATATVTCLLHLAWLAQLRLRFEKQK